MKIEDLVQLLNNRLREFKLSRDYAKMSGDLERMNVADKEVLALEDTLYQLSLLVDISKSAAVRNATLVEVMTDGSVAVLGEYDITPYATDPLHEEKIMNILSKMAVMDTVEKIDDYIKGKYLSSPVTGEMIMSAAEAYAVDARLMMAIMEQDSSFGTAGKAVGTLNPGNVGNNDAGDTITYGSWQEGVTAVARWLNMHHITEGILIEETPTPEPTPVVETGDTSGTASESASFTAEQSPTPTPTPPPTPTPEPSTTPTPTPEITPTPTPRDTPIPTPEPTPTPTPSDTPTPTPTPTPETTPEPTPEPTPTPDVTPTPTPETTPEPTPTSTPN